MADAIQYATPVELTNFTASLNDDMVILEWETATELNNSGWEIERSFSGSDHFKTIGFVMGAGTTGEPQVYSFEDQLNQFGKYLYHIKQIDYDGSFEYGNQVDVDFISVQKKDTYLASYPNPFNPNCTILIDLAYDSDVELIAYNILGEEVKRIYAGNLQSGRYQYSFDGQNLPSGIYVLALQTNKELITYLLTLAK